MINFIHLISKRTVRIIQHFSLVSHKNLPSWSLELMFQLFDLLAISDLYDVCSRIIKFNSRPLSRREIVMSESVFGKSIPYERVRVDERAYLGPRQGKFCYVSFYTINSWGKMSDPLLIHELMHVWQYHHLGMVYIPRALAAQRSREGYDYGGADALYEAFRNNKKLLDFNYEQQADIIEDYFRLLLGYHPSWGCATAADLSVYAHFARQLNI